MGSTVPSGPLLCVVGRYEKLHLLNPKTLDSNLEIATRKRNCRVVRFPERKRWVAISEHDGRNEDDPERVLIYDMDRGTRPRTVCQATSRGAVIRGLDTCALESREVVVFANWRGECHVADGETGLTLVSLSGAPPETRCLKCCGAWNDGEALVVGGTRAYRTLGPESLHEVAVRLFDIRRGELLQKFDGHANAVTGVDCMGEGFCTVSADSSLLVWARDSPSSRLRFRLRCPGSSVLCLPEKNLVVCGESEGYVETFDLRATGTDPLLRFQHHADYITYHSENPTEISLARIDAGVGASVGEDKNVFLFEFASGKKLAHTMVDEGHNAFHYGVCLVG